MKTDSDRLKVSAVIECKRVIWSAAVDPCARVRVRDALLMEEQLVSIPHSFLLSRCCSLGRRWIPSWLEGRLWVMARPHEWMKCCTKGWRQYNQITPIQCSHSYTYCMANFVFQAVFKSMLPLYHCYLFVICTICTIKLLSEDKEHWQHLEFCML